MFACHVLKVFKLWVWDSGFPGLLKTRFSWVGPLCADICVNTAVAGFGGLGLVGFSVKAAWSRFLALRIGASNFYSAWGHI